MPSYQFTAGGKKTLPCLSLSCDPSSSSAAQEPGQDQTATDTPGKGKEAAGWQGGEGQVHTVPSALPKAGLPPYLAGSAGAAPSLPHPPVPQMASVVKWLNLSGFFVQVCLPHPTKCSEFSMSNFENGNKTGLLKSLCTCPATDISSPSTSCPVTSENAQEVSRLHNRMEAALGNLTKQGFHFSLEVFLPCKNTPYQRNYYVDSFCYVTFQP